MSLIIVESQDLREWGEVLIVLGRALADLNPKVREFAELVQNMGIKLHNLSSIAPLASAEDISKESE